jgi:hypothetical protein
MDGRLTCFLTDDFDLTVAIRGEAMMGVTGEVKGIGIVDELEGWFSA